MATSVKACFCHNRGPSYSQGATGSSQFPTPSQDPGLWAAAAAPWVCRRPSSGTASTPVWPFILTQQQLGALGSKPAVPVWELCAWARTLGLSTLIACHVVAGRIHHKSDGSFARVGEDP